MTHPQAPALRATARRLKAVHPDLGVHQHLTDAANALDHGLHEGAQRHLRAAIGLLTPQSLRRHGLLTDDQHDAAKASMDAVHRHLLLLKEHEDSRPQNGAMMTADFSNDEYYIQALNLANERRLAANARRESARRAQDAARPRRASFEDRIELARERISAGTYTDPQAAVELANEGGGCSCGAVSGDGTVRSTCHYAGCEQAMTSDEQAAQAHGSAASYLLSQPFRDANGRVFVNAATGEPMTVSDHFEAASGVRRTRSAFEAQDRAEMAQPVTGTRWGDPDDPDNGGGLPMENDSQRYISSLRSRLGFPDAAAQRQAERDHAATRLAMQGGPRPRTIGEAMDYGESRQERAERMKSGSTQKIGWQDGNHLPGEMVGLTNVPAEPLDF